MQRIAFGAESRLLLWVHFTLGLQHSPCAIHAQVYISWPVAFSSCKLMYACDDDDRPNRSLACRVNGTLLTLTVTSSLILYMHDASPFACKCVVNNLAACMHCRASRVTQLSLIDWLIDFIWYHYLLPHIGSMHKAIIVALCIYTDLLRMEYTHPRLESCGENFP
jgi:hypothetical protein